MDPNAQVAVKTAEARAMVWMKADLIQDGHCFGTGIEGYEASGNLVSAPPEGYCNILEF